MKCIAAILLLPCLCFAQVLSPMERAQLEARLGADNSVSRAMIQPGSVSLSKVDQTSLSTVFATRLWAESEILSALGLAVTPEELAGLETDPTWAADKPMYALKSYVDASTSGVFTEAQVKSLVYGTNSEANLYSGVLTNAVAGVTNFFRVYRGLIYQP